MSTLKSVLIVKQFMYDKKLVSQILTNIEWSIEKILKRSEEINNYEQFIISELGLQKLDSICMQLINIGEAIKQIDKITNDSLLCNYKGIDWKAAKGMRDIISHHYFDIDAEVVFKTIREKLPQLKLSIAKIISDLN